MPQLLSKGQSLVASPKSLVWIAQMPHSKGRIREAKHPGVLAVAKSQGAVPMGVIKPKPLLRVCSRWSKIPQAKQSYSQCTVSFYEERRVFFALGQTQELLPKLKGCL
jgi:hypothetical protein